MVVAAATVADMRVADHIRRSVRPMMMRRGGGDWMRSKRKTKILTTMTMEGVIRLVYHTTSITRLSTPLPPPPPPPPPPPGLSLSQRRRGRTTTTTAATATGGGFHDHVTTWSLLQGRRQY